MLGDIDYYHLYRWGHYRTLAGLHGRIHGHISDAGLNAYHLSSLGLCHFTLGDYRQAIDLHTQALEIYRDIGYRYGEANGLDGLGRAWLALGDAGRAVLPLTQAVTIADSTGDLQTAVESRSWLARARLQAGDPAAALATTTARPELSYPTEEPMMRLLEGLALLELHRVQESVEAFTAALTAADALLVLADSNVAALQARALALSGLAAALGDQARATEAGNAFTQMRTTTTAAGLAADTRRLLEAIAAHAHAAAIAETLAAQEL